MDSTATIAASAPTQICGCAIDRVLTDLKTYLAVGPGGRRVVLKQIDSDCLIGAALHPVVRDRLSRVRELAHASVANLFGVEREGTDAWLMWEYVDGVTIDFHAGANRTPREVASVLREMVLAVDLLHMQGIVHGALIASNVIVTPGGAVRLTHISPLIYTDPQVDVDCVWNLLEMAADQLGERGAPLALTIREGREQRWPLRQLATRLGPLIDARDARQMVVSDSPVKASARRHAYFGAAVVALLGMAMAWGAWRVVESGRLPLTDSLQHPFHNQPDR